MIGKTIFNYILDYLKINQISKIIKHTDRIKGVIFIMNFLLLLEEIFIIRSLIFHY